MQTYHSTFTLAHHLLHRIEFLPETFSDGDLLWLPHHADLAHFGKKRRIEHLAGRIAAAYALQPFGLKAIPGIGEQRQPLWPEGIFGSISHSGKRAIAAVSRKPVGIDIEHIFSSQLAAEVATQIASPAEIFRLQTSGLPFAIALTLAFSAKESVYKAFSSQAEPCPGFAAAEMTAIDENALCLRLAPAFSARLAGKEISVAYEVEGDEVVTCTVTPL
ncbi:enterobactin synthase subunit EntD [Pseudocitrobacter faecalis]|uniref:Enterobactin synthase component D n=1 Tax=Pseudocitrobacter faecalis TaxID=1398493 RepID=A0ABX9G1E4_9ENTR|nr:enterobactin synthetase component D [Pseudocitrobacter faecalis]